MKFDLNLPIVMMIRPIVMMALTRIRMGLISEVPTLRGKREKMGAGMTIHRLSKKLAKQIRQMMTLRTGMGNG
jgi:hypothetical protein